jgi:hypothetical protein
LTELLQFSSAVFLLSQQDKVMAFNLKYFLFFPLVLRLTKLIFLFCLQQQQQQQHQQLSTLAFFTCPKRFSPSLPYPTPSFRVEGFRINNEEQILL